MNFRSTMQNDVDFYVEEAIGFPRCQGVEESRVDFRWIPILGGGGSVYKRDNHTYKISEPGLRFRAGNTEYNESVY